MRMTVCLYVENKDFDDIIDHLGASCPLEILDEEPDYEFECDLCYDTHPADPDVGYSKPWHEILSVTWTDDKGKIYDMEKFFSEEYLYNYIQDRKVLEWY